MLEQGPQLPHGMSGLPPCVDGSLQVRRFHEQIVGVESRNGEDADGSFGQRLNEGRQHADRGEGNRASELQAPAVSLTQQPIGKERLHAHDGEFLGSGVIEENPPFVAQAGTAASASSLQMAKVSGSRVRVR